MRGGGAGGWRWRSTERRETGAAEPPARAEETPARREISTPAADEHAIVRRPKEASSAQVRESAPCRHAVARDRRLGEADRAAAAPRVRRREQRGLCRQAGRD